MTNAETLNLSARRDEVLRKIAAARDGAFPADQAGDLLNEALDMVAQLRAAAIGAKESALDPALPSEQVAAALAEANAAEHDAQRIGAAYVLLGAIKDKHEREAKLEQLEKAYEAAKARRDRCADRIKAEYPKLQAALAGLIEEIVAAGLAVDAINKDLPPGAKILERPEGFARGFVDHMLDDVPLNHRVNRISQMTIPDIAKPEGLIWPPGLLLHRDGAPSLPFTQIVRLFRNSRAAPPA